jgi:hypothetical protein
MLIMKLRVQIWSDGDRQTIFEHHSNLNLTQGVVISHVLPLFIITEV